MTATLELSNVTKRFGEGHLEVDALTDVSMTVEVGEQIGRASCRERVYVLV